MPPSKPKTTSRPKFALRRRPPSWLAAAAFAVALALGFSAHVDAQRSGGSIGGGGFSGSSSSSSRSSGSSSSSSSFGSSSGGGSGGQASDTTTFFVALGFNAVSVGAFGLSGLRPGFSEYFTKKGHSKTTSHKTATALTFGSWLAIFVVTLLLVDDWGLRGLGLSGVLTLFAWMFLFAMPSIFFLATRKDHGASGGRPSVIRLRLAIDWHARAALQESLRALAERVDTSRRRDLLEVLHETARRLRAAEVSWLYGSVEERVEPNEPAATRLRATWANEARVGFRIETIRAASGERTTTDAGDLVARAHEGEGLVLVTLVVLSSQPIDSAPAQATSDALAIKATLAELLSPSFEASFAGVDVIWTPSEDNDRMSSAEFEALYLEVAKLDATKLIGRRTCTYCRALFAAELGQCASCGAPSGERGRV
jgi:uncharacterized membrane protein